jgi:hypothetical protein
MNLCYIRWFGHVTDERIEGPGRRGATAYVRWSRHLTDEYM